MKTWRLAIYIGLEATSPVRLKVDDSAIIGRADDMEGFKPHFDLAPFGARDAGVSRRHAEITVIRDQLYITDLGSVNGTRINGVKLTPHQRYPLQNGDRLQCGNLRMVLYVL